MENVTKQTFLNEEEIREIKELFLSGMSPNKIRIKIHRNYETVVNVLGTFKLFTPKSVDLWTKEEDDKLIELRVNQKLSYDNIAKIFNCHTRRIKARADKLNICDRYNQFNWTIEVDNKLESLINEKKPLAEIAEILGCTLDIVSRRCKKIGLKSKARRLLYTKDQLDIIQEYYLEGKQDIVVAKIVHLPVDEIKHIRRKEKIQNKKNQKWSINEDALLLEMLRKELSLKEIRKKLRRSGTQIMKSIKRLIPSKDRTVHEKRILYTITKYYTTDVVKTKLLNARLRCTKKNWKYDLDETFIQELYEKQDGLCFYTGVELEVDPGTNKFFSIDRVDSLKGYTKDNIVLCTWEINKLKSNLPIKKFREICHLVDTNCPFSPEYEI